MAGKQFILSHLVLPRPSHTLLWGNAAPFTDGVVSVRWTLPPQPLQRGWGRQSCQATSFAGLIHEETQPCIFCDVSGNEEHSFLLWSEPGAAGAPAWPPWGTAAAPMGGRSQHTGGGKRGRNGFLMSSKPGCSQA